ncbi:MAG: protein-disulfide reductase DsbD [Lysobacter sp.]|nr:protein-disulfide reductase DsbD [Lysobacter sp.]
MTIDLSLLRCRRAGWITSLGRASVLLAALVAAPALAAIDEKDLLPVDDAFVLSAQQEAPGRIAVKWQVAEGYYLYRHRISVKSDANFAARALQLPKGKAYEDEFFGKVETYRGTLAATLPGQAQGPSSTLTINYQGCADAGVCYPPQTRRLAVALPGPTAQAPSRGLLGGNSLGGSSAMTSGNPLGNLLGDTSVGNADALPLPPEIAFGFQAIVGDGNTLLLRFTPAPGYYLYRDKTSLRLDTDRIKVGVPQWPAGTAHEDGYFGRTVVFFDRIDVPVALQRMDAAPTRVTLLAGFQGCQTDGICYPPMTRSITLDLPAGTVATAAMASAPGSATPDATAATGVMPAPDVADPAAATGTGATVASVSTVAAGGIAAPQAGTGVQGEDGIIAAALAGPDRWVALLSFFGFGLLLAFTPCVLPMIPILSGLIAGHGPDMSTRKAFTLSLVYVLSSALVFTVAGVVAGLVGANLQIAFQTPWVIAAFALLFVALALSSFGLYELQLPAALRNRLGAVTNRQHGGSLAGVAVMGALSALIVGPCVAPPLAAAVLYIGQTQDPVFGGAALFLLAMGMGVPLIAFGVAAGRGLPTSGPWMLAVQRVFGLVFLGLAVWMLSRVVPGAVTLTLWGALVLGAAAMLAMALSRPNPTTGEGVRTLGWTTVALLGVVGAAQVLGAMAGGSDPLQPLAGLRGGSTESRELPFRKIKSLDDLERAVAAAHSAGQPLLLDFYADWCVSCKEMEKYTFPDPTVHAALSGFHLLKVDVTANDAIDQELMKHLQIIGPPATLYYVDGIERRDLRLFGFEKPAPFAARAQRAGRAPAAAGAAP